MKPAHFIYLLLISLPTFFSCKKSNDAAGTPELKNTIWSGEFHYTSGGYTGLQPFTVSANADGTLDWADITSTRPAGSWKVTDNRVTMTFPNATTSSATIGQDKWTDFVSPAINGFQIDNLSRATVINSSVLVGTSWSGDTDGKILKLKFLDASNMELTLGSAAAVPVKYGIAGSGIRFEITFISGLSSNAYYAIFQTGNTSLKGFETSKNVSVYGYVYTYATWNAKKQ